MKKRARKDHASAGRRKDHVEWLVNAEIAGLDWEKPQNLPPREMLTEGLLAAALQDAPTHITKFHRELLTSLSASRLRATVGRL